jgi:hypothetical protein
LRIGILTYHAAYNFGAGLQALSTFRYLKNNGYEPIVIDFFPEDLEKAFNRLVPAVQAEAHKEFLEKNLVLTGRCRNAVDIARIIESNDIQAVIIGSDAVVQHFPLLSRIRVMPSAKKLLTIRIDPVKYDTNFPNPFWGEFLQHLTRAIPVAMMSVSCQNTEFNLFPGREKDAINRMTGKIKYISVRDKRTSELFKYVSNGTRCPEITPDPVFAFNDNVLDVPGKEEILNKFDLPERYILLSFSTSKAVNKFWISSFETIASQNGYRCIALSMPEGIKFDNDLEHKIGTPLHPMDWYGLIKYSSGYVGTKMHPVIVSLHNNVPFFSFDHYGILKFKLFLNQKASKIFQVLERAGMVDYRVPIIKKISYKPPTPEYVFRKIALFNKDKCRSFAERMRLEYKAMMFTLLDELSKPGTVQ